MSSGNKKVKGKSNYENTKIKCMLNDIFNGVYQESSDKRD